MTEVGVFPVGIFIGIRNGIVREKILPVAFAEILVGGFRYEIIAADLQLLPPLIAEIDTGAPAIGIAIAGRTTGTSAIATAPVGLETAHAAHAADQVVES